MSDRSMRRRTAPGPRPEAPLLARAALAVYPPAWRARYGQEALGLLCDLDGGLAAAASLAWRAIPAWLWPPPHLHDRTGRMRSSLATVLVAWSALAGLGLVFEQLTQQQVRPAGHPVIGWSYGIFDVAFLLSGLILAAGSLPLWLLMMRRARRQRSARDTVRLLMPALAPAAFLAGLAILIQFIRQPNGIGTWWFLTITLGGFAAGIAAAAGPGLALRSLRPRGPAVRLAVGACAASVATMLLACLASVVASIDLTMGAREFGGYHRAGPVVIYLALLSAAATVAAISAGRGARAALAGPPGT